MAQAAVERANEGLGADDVNRRCCFFGAAENQFVLFSESWYKIERRQLELNRSFFNFLGKQRAGKVELVLRQKELLLRLDQGPARCISHRFSTRRSFIIDSET